VESPIPWIENRHVRGNKFACVATDDDKIGACCHGGYEEIGFGERVSPPSALFPHQTPAQQDIFRYRENTSCEQRSYRTIEPLGNIGAPGRIAQLLDAEADLGEGDFGREQCVPPLRANETPNLLVRPRTTQLGNDVRIDQPAPQSFTSRIGAFSDSLSIGTSFNGELANASTRSRPETGLWRRSHSSAATTTMASFP
jgi:hypothetical protein